MTDNVDTTVEQSLAPAVKPRSRTAGDIPDDLRRRYLTEPEPGGVAFYVDRVTKQPAFRDRGGRLIADRASPAALRDMATIAHHRGWETVVITGGAPFRRDAWMALRTTGLQVRGYRPTARDRQALERQLDRGRTPISPPMTSVRKKELADDHAARSRLAVVETVLRDRISDPGLHKRAIAAARSRIAMWLERGAHFGIASVANPDLKKDPTFEPRPRERGR